MSTQDGRTHFPPTFPAPHAESRHPSEPTGRLNSALGRLRPSLPPPGLTLEGGGPSYLEAWGSLALMPTDHGREEAKHLLHHLGVGDSVVDGLALPGGESTLALLLSSGGDQQPLHTQPMGGGYPQGSLEQAPHRRQVSLLLPSPTQIKVFSSKLLDFNSFSD